MSSIIFKSITARNFRSIDNMGLTLDFQPGNTLIGSVDNGAGKSTILVHALYYVLFDKAYAKGTSKTQLINSRSNKDSVVSVEFHANGSDWHVTRGQKPTVFSIVKDGKPIIDEASLKDYQTNLSKAIGMDEKVFNNTVALGKDKFVPFVSMSAPDRRNYGDQMLDLTVISGMNEENKAGMKVLAANISTTNATIFKAENEIASIQRVVDTKKQAAQEAAGVVDEDITREKAEAERIKLLKADLDVRLPPAKELAEAVEAKVVARNKSKALLAQAKASISELETMLIANLSNTACPHCKQEMPKESLEAHAAVLQEKLDGLKRMLPAAEKHLASFDVGIDVELAQATADLRSIQDGIIIADSQVTGVLNRLKVLYKRKEDAAKVVNWDSELNQIEGIEREVVEYKAELNALNTVMVSHKVMEAALKDDGFKAKIVDQYLPFINERINMYLDHMNLCVSVELNSEFELDLKSPDRKGQGIQCLSTGQQCRIDLSVLLAWRDVAKAASSCSTNILVLDEILENLSGQGVVDFIEMLETMDNGDQGLYVISQRVSEFEPLFDRSVIYKLVDDATVIHSAD